MNLFNRIFMILFLVALIAAIVGLLALAWTIPNRSLDGLREAVQWLDDNDQDFEKSVLTAVGVGIASVAFVLLILELLPRSPTDVKVTDLKAGDAVLSTAAIGQRVEEAVTQVPSVADVKAYVKAKRKGVNLLLDLHVDPDANLAYVTDEAIETARDVLSNKLHVALNEGPRVRIHYRELRLRRGQAPARQPATVATPAALPLGETVDGAVVRGETIDRDDAVIEMNGARETDTAVVSQETPDASPDVIDPLTGEKRDAADTAGTRRDA